MSRRSRLSAAVATVLALGAGAAYAALTLDATFDSDGLATIDFANNLDGARGIAVQTDQKLVLAGMSRQTSGGNTFDYLALARLNTDGSLDSTFGTAGKVTSLPPGTSNFGGADGRAVAMQTDGKILVAGTYNDNTGGGKKLLVARYSASGVLDSTFGSGGYAIVGSGGNTPAVAEAIAVQTDGRIVVAGRAEPNADYFRGVIVRLDSSGALDTTFATGGIYTLAVSFQHVSFRTVDVLSTNHIVAGGTDGNLLMVKLNSAGVPDATFDSDGVASINVGTITLTGGATMQSEDGIEGLAVLSDGSFLVAGDATTNQTGTARRPVVARITAAGALDTTYGASGYVATATYPTVLRTRWPYDVVALPSGEAIVAGLNFDPTQISADGTAASLLTGSTGFQATLRLAKQLDGKVVGAGEIPVAGADYSMGAFRIGVTSLGGGTPPDTTPDAFSFVDQTNVALSSQIVSAPITVTGITAAAAVTVTGGEYSVGCTGTFVSSAGTVNNGQTICVRHTSSANNSAATNTTLTIGGVSDIFTSTTLAPAVDTTPDAFAFADQTNVALSSSIVSAPIAIAGINAAAAVSITGGEYSVGCTGTFTSAAGTVNNAQTICVRHTSSATNGTATNTTLTVGGVSDTFTSTTLAFVADTTPDAFTFTDQTNVAVSTSIVSAPITVAGINSAAAISITGGEYSVGCTGTFASAAGTVSNGQTVCVRHTSSVSNSTATNSVLTIGGVSDTFTSTTAAAAPTPPPSKGGGAIDWMLGLALLGLARLKATRANRI